jgi:hypothetical protein
MDETLSVLSYTQNMSLWQNHEYRRADKMERRGKSGEKKWKKYPVLKADVQLDFFGRLQSMRRMYLHEALSTGVKALVISKLDGELTRYLGGEYLGKLAEHGLRGEVIFPVPYLLEATPELLGYYRLLYGHSQKEFYNKGPFGGWRALEERGGIPEKMKPGLPSLCESLIATGKGLVDGLTKLNLETVHELQLLTLGPQFRGSRNTSLGQIATKAVFELVKSLVKKSIVKSTPTTILVENASKRHVSVEFSSDPDIAIREKLPSGDRPLVSIEIKGGTDYSNIHNRVGEAEKSHQKARQMGFFEFWTIIGVSLDYEEIKKESPTTSHFFQLTRITERNDAEYEKFRDLLGSVMGVRTNH